MATFKIGDHVHLHNYDKDMGNGIITEIKPEHTLDWVPFIAIYVEYDKPLPGRWPYQNHTIHRGRHIEDELELI